MNDQLFGLMTFPLCRLIYFSYYCFAGHWSYNGHMLVIHLKAKFAGFSSSRFSEIAFPISIGLHI